MTDHTFLAGKTPQALALYEHFLSCCALQGAIEVRATKSMLAIMHHGRSIAWVTQLGKNFVHIVFPFEQAYPDNLCFTKIAVVPGSTPQVNHHFRMMDNADVNEEVKRFIALAMRAS